MSYQARHALAQLLAGEGALSRHSASLNLPSEALNLTVDGYGVVSLPLRAAEAKRLIRLARPAHVGRGTETLLDDSVRDTWEIPAELISLNGPSWEANLDNALRELGAELGIAPTARLRPELHSLLIYGTGQFFAPHQDSEKDDAMVATLVVFLPTSHTGGELVIDDGGESVQYSASDYELTLVAFYADRRHEVLPVRRGYRGSMTFNLILEPGEESETGHVGAAMTLLHEHFSTPPEYSWRRGGQPPNVLAFLLDHEYSQHGLSAGLLKGADATRVATLTASAELAGYEYAFAHANIQETHQAYEEGSFGWGRWGYYDDEVDTDELEIGEVIDSSVELTWWSDAKAKGKISLPLDEDEVCTVTPSEVLEPFESQYEGYMGNYGNTIERWYYRTLLLIWPAHRGALLRAEANREWALSGIVETLEHGNLGEAREQAQALLPVASHIPTSEFATLLQVAAGVDDAELAHLLLGPFSIEALTSDHAALVAELLETYGRQWWTRLLDTWEIKGRFGHPSRIPWIEETVVALSAGLSAEHSAHAASALLESLNTWLTRTVKTTLAYEHTGKRDAALKRLGPVTAALIEARAQLAEGTSTLLEIFKELGEPALPLFIAALRAFASPPPKEGIILAHEVHHLLTTALARPARAVGDWSIAWDSPGGEDADRLAEFLHSSEQTVLEWPIAKPRRQEIHRFIEGADLPVQHLTRRVGSPYTLVLTKTAELFNLETRIREQHKDDARWIEAQFPNSPK